MDESWAEPINEGLQEATKNLCFANIAKQNYSEKLPSNCDFLLIPEMNMEIFCLMPTHAKRHDVKLQKQQKLLPMFSLKIIKILNNFLNLKGGEKTDAEILKTG